MATAQTKVTLDRPTAASMPAGTSLTFETEHRFPELAGGWGGGLGWVARCACACVCVCGGVSSAVSNREPTLPPLPHLRPPQGFHSAAAYTSTADVSYGLYVTYRNHEGPVGGVNSRYTADGWNGHNAVRESEARGGGQLTPRFASSVVRVKLNNSPWSLADVDWPLDLSQLDPDLRGFADCFVVGAHLYLVPYRNRVGQQAERHEGSYGFFGKLVKVDLEKSWLPDGTVTLDHVTILDLAQVAGEVRTASLTPS